MRVFLIAGEPSGDALGQSLMAGLKSLVPDVKFDGVGGAKMQAEGLVSRFDMSELSVMGIAEVLPRYFHLKRRIAELAQAVVETQADVLLTIDSPDFCLRVAKLVKARSAIRTVHYVAPSVWAWRPGRAKKMSGAIDHVLALLPFEPPYMEAAGMSCDFVGHPVVTQPVASDAEATAFRNSLGLENAHPLVLVLPGSRKGEVSRMGPVFGQAMAGFASQQPAAKAVVVAASAVEHDVRSIVQHWPVEGHVVSGDDLSTKRAAFRAADMALAASGTVSLELAAAETPMVIGYRMNPLSYQIIRRMALIDTVTLVNIVTGRLVVPECLGPECSAGNLIEAMQTVFEAPDKQLNAFAETMHALGQGGDAPGLRAARSVLSHLQST